MSTLAFDWTGYLGVAKELSFEGATEAQLRSAVSRAYYAAFNSARLVYEFKHGKVPNRTVHSDLWNGFLLNGKNRDTKRIGTNGSRLRDLRRKTDYDSIVSLDLKIEAPRAVLMAENLLSSLQGAEW